MAADPACDPIVANDWMWPAIGIVGYSSKRKSWPTNLIAVGGDDGETPERPADGVAIRSATGNFVVDVEMSATRPTDRIKERLDDEWRCLYVPTVSWQRLLAILPR